MLWSTLVVSVLVAIVGATTSPDDCDLTPVSFGCPSLLEMTSTVNTSAMFNIAVAATSPAIPLRVISVERAEVAHLQTINASETRVVLETTSYIASITLDDTTGAMRFEATTLAWVSNGSLITIDVTTGCLLVNGTLPPKSPCLNTDILTPPQLQSNTSVDTPSPPAMLNALDSTIAAILVPSIVGIVGFLIGFVIACPVGMCAQRRRMRKQHENGGAHDPLGHPLASDLDVNLDNFDNY